MKNAPCSGANKFAVTGQMEAGFIPLKLAAQAAILAPRASEYRLHP
jgi:hypothetical protein